MIAADAAWASGEGLTVYGLQCEYRTTPLGIGEAEPRLSWRLRSGRRGDYASAARVVVMRMTADGGLAERVWDSGWRDAPPASNVTYAGAPLESSTRYRWQVELRDAHGDPAEVAASWFDTGLLQQGDWHARWIARDPESAGVADPPADDDILGAGLIGHLNRRLPPCAFLRTTFETSQPPVSCRLVISAKGLYEARLNGRRVGDHELAPGWTDYRHRIQYQCYDVSDLVAVGENVFGVILGDGWFCGRVGPGGRVLGEHYGARTELIAQLQLTYADGSRQIVISDGDWRTTVGPLRFSDLLAGEYVDARRDLGSWDMPGYDASNWSAALVCGGDTSLLVASSDEPVRVMQLLTPRAIEQRDGKLLVDFGQNMVGRVRITLRDMPRGSRVVLRHGEAVTAEGDLYTANLRLASATDMYVAAGAPVETFEPRFTCHGFRYVEVDGYAGTLDPADITGVVLHSDTTRAGQLTTSDDQVNQLLSNIWWSQRGNFVSVPTDCPQRDERLGWLADAQVFLPTACYNADVAAFFARWMGDVVSSRLPTGAFPDVAPRLVFEREGAPGWGDGGVVIPWHLWRTYGDRRVLERSFPAMVGWVAHIRAANPDLIWRKRVGNHYGDWLAVNAKTPREVVATAYFAHSATLVAQAAEVVGEDAQARSHHELAAKIGEAFRREFVLPGGHIVGETQTGYLLALSFGLLPQHLAANAAGHLAADIQARGNRLTTGFLGVALLCPVLTAYGHADLAYALLHQDAYPSWNYSIAHGATTIWERWDGWTAERGFQSVAMNSLNHYSLGSVGEWLYRSVAGIGQSATSVAFADLDIRPVPGGRLTSATASYESARGRIETAWRIDGGVLHLTVLIPPGATATLVVPTSDAATVRESGQPVASAPGIAVIGTNERGVSCRVGSGRYQFVAVR